MKNIIFIALALSLVSVIRAQKPAPPPDPSKTLTWIEKEQYGLRLEGIEICLLTSSVSARAGASSVPVIVSFRNPSSDPVSFRRRALDEIFDIEVTNSVGEKILSFNEIVEKKIREKTATVEESIRELPIRSGPLSIEINPREEKKAEYNLSNIYDFSVKDKYEVKFREKGAKEPENLIGTISVEIK